MRRLALLTLVVSAVTLTCASTATATALRFDPLRAIAMTDNYVYWVQRGTSNCRDCRKLWRTDTATGERSVVFSLKHGFLDDLRAGRSAVAFTVKEPGREYRTSIRLFDEARGLSELASATYYPRRTSNCGSQVGVGAVSTAGEVAWSKIEFAGQVKSCTAFAGRAKWSAYAAGSTAAARMIVQARPIASDEVGYRYALVGGVISIYGFDGTRLLAFDNSHGTVVFDTLTKSKVIYGIFVREQYGEELTPSGAVIALDPEPSADGYTDIGVLLPNAMDPKTVVPLPLTGYETNAFKPCGSRLVQLGISKRSAVVVIRDAAGAVLSTQSLKVPASAGLYSLDCSSRLAMLRIGLVKDPVGGGLVGYRTRTFAID